MRLWMVGARYEHLIDGQRVHFFVENITGHCALCGSTISLTGEHKIKASLLKAEFGTQQMKFFSAETSQLKLVQGPKSKAFQFRSRLCNDCNSTTTQPADIAFSVLHETMKLRRERGEELTDCDHRPMYNCSREDELNVFRYFAKILCCYMAEVGGPRPLQVALFAIGQLEQNPIFLNVRDDANYDEKRLALGSNGYAETGGLVLKFDEGTRVVKSIASALSVSGVCYEFDIRLTTYAATELQFVCPQIVDTALANIASEI